MKMIFIINVCLFLIETCETISETVFSIFLKGQFELIFVKIDYGKNSFSVRLIINILYILTLK